MTNPEKDLAIRDQALSRLYLFVVISIGSGLIIGNGFTRTKSLSAKFIGLNIHHGVLPYTFKTEL